MITLGDTAWDLAALQRYASIGFAVIGLAGLVLLLFGVRVVRLFFAVLFAALGAGVGLVVINLLSKQIPFLGHHPWVPLAAGAAVIGVLGFLLHRLWVILALGGVLALLAAAGYLGVTSSAELGRCWAQYGSAPDARAAETPAGDARAAAEQKQAELGQAIQKLTREHALGMSLSATAGLVLGLLLAGFAYRLAAVLLTSLLGVQLLVLGLAGLASVHWPNINEQVAGLGWKSAAAAGVLWVIGVALQAALARQPAGEGEPKSEQPKDKKS